MNTASNRFLISICLLSLILTACNKEKIESNGKVSALLNGMFWQGEIRAATRFDKLDLVMEKYQHIGNNFLPWETMQIVYFQKNLLKQRIIPSDSLKVYAPWDAIHAYGNFSTAQSDGDVACDLYQIIESDSTNNWVRIDREAGNYSQVWGSFAMHLYRTQTCNSTVYPDTLLITNGKFEFGL